MPIKDVAAKVKEIVGHELFVDEDALDPEADLKAKYDMDSLDAIEIIMSLEECFDIHISDDEAEKLQTVNDAINLVESKKGIRQ